ncbi:hypothetical protein K502DRAFT_366648 [Neoconidiobolus thromboides FSU 785]|nr:hypothetical protein K502DRAFT_366648 [Neoconidiobolus thromboides FSU 785]
MCANKTIGASRNANSRLNLALTSSVNCHGTRGINYKEHASSSITPEKVDNDGKRVGVPYLVTGSIDYDNTVNYYNDN